MELEWEPQRTLPQETPVAADSISSWIDPKDLRELRTRLDRLELAISGIRERIAILEAI